MDYLSRMERFAYGFKSDRIILEKQIEENNMAAANDIVSTLLIDILPEIGFRVSKRKIARNYLLEFDSLLNDVNKILLSSLCSILNDSKIGSWDFVFYRQPTETPIEYNGEVIDDKDIDISVFFNSKTNMFVLDVRPTTVVSKIEKDDLYPFLYLMMVDRVGEFILDTFVERLYVGGKFKIRSNKWKEVKLNKIDEYLRTCLSNLGIDYSNERGLSFEYYKTRMKSDDSKKYYIEGYTYSIDLVNAMSVKNRGELSYLNSLGVRLFRTEIAKDGISEQNIKSLDNKIGLKEYNNEGVIFNISDTPKIKYIDYFTYSDSLAKTLNKNNNENIKIKEVLVNENSTN